jgi:hypothetical protein
MGIFDFFNSKTEEEKTREKKCKEAFDECKSEKPAPEEVEEKLTEISRGGRRKSKSNRRRKTKSKSKARKSRRSRK